MSNLFSSFNPNVTLFDFVVRLNWLSSVLVLLIIPQIFWLRSRKSVYVINYITSLLCRELKAVLGSMINPGRIIFFISLFIFILFNNFMGLFPYVFTASRHFSFTLSISLPLWVGYILQRFIIQFNYNISHLVPEGTPAALIPLIVLIESIRLIIRPFTLAIRLAANIVAGHLLLTLLGNQGPSRAPRIITFLLLALVLLIVLECAVSCIQRYVFTILSSLYLGEHVSSELCGSVC